MKKKTILILNISIIILSLFWLLYEPGFEPVIALISSTIVLGTYKFEIKDEIEITFNRYKAYFSFILLIFIVLLMYLAFNTNKTIGIYGNNNNSNDIKITK